MSDSNSSSAQSTSYTDNRMVLGQGAINANNGATVYALDGGAIGKSFDFASNTVDKAFQFGEKNNQDAINFASDSLQQTLAASRESARYAAQSAADSIAFAQDANNKSIAVQRESIGTAADSMASALAYGGKQTAVALDSLQGSAELVKNAYADAKGRGSMTDYLLMAAIGVAGLVAYGAMKH